MADPYTQEIDIGVKALLVADSDMISLLNIDASTHRIYYWRPASNITYNTTYDSAIIYRSFINSLPFQWSYLQQIEDMTYFFRVFSTDQSKSRQISEKLTQLLNPHTQPLTLTNFSVKVIKVISNADGMTETGSTNEVVYSRNVNIKFENVFRR